MKFILNKWTEVAFWLIIMYLLLANARQASLLLATGARATREVVGTFQGRG